MQKLKKMQTKLSVILASVLLLSCQGVRPRPEAPALQRCLVLVPNQIEICYLYKIDVKGGLTDETTRVERAITNKNICFSPDEWNKLINWRDDIILWAEEVKKVCKK